MPIKLHELIEAHEKGLIDDKDFIAAVKKLAEKQTST